MSEQEPGQGIYLISYPYRGERWNIQMPAESFEDAEARLRALSMGKVDGFVREFITMPPSHLAPLAHAYVRLKVWLANRIAKP